MAKEEDDRMEVVILPAYKPDENLIHIADQLWGYGCRIVVVDDGSGKEYWPIFEKISDISMVLRHLENRGKGAAIKTALNYVNEEFGSGTVIGVMDCDGQHLPEDMMRLLAFAGGHPKTMVLGVRKVGKEMPLKSRLGNQLTRTVFHLFSGVKVSDTQTGLRAFDSELLETLLSVEGERYEYETNVLMKLAKTGIPMEEIPIHTIYLDQKNSCSHFRAVRDSIRIYKDLLKFMLSSFSSFLLDYVLFSLLMVFLSHTPFLIAMANILARMGSAFYNYCMNCRFVFHTGKKAGTAVSYFGLAVFVLLMNNGILETLVQIFHLSVYPAKLLTEGLLFLLSWTVQKQLIFRKEKEASGSVTMHLSGGKA